MIYLLFQDSFYVDLFDDYVCDLLTGLVLRFTFCPSITFELDLFHLCLSDLLTGLNRYCSKILLRYFYMFKENN